MIADDKARPHEGSGPADHTPTSLTDLELAFEAGQMYERHRLAEAYAELDAAWRPVGRRSREQRIAQRIAEAERWAAAQPWNTWAGRYPGGPVDFETGMPCSQIGAAA